MITKEQIEKFITEIQEQVEAMNNKTAGLSVEQQIARTGLAITQAQAELLLVEEQKLQALRELLANMEGTLSTANLPAQDFIKQAGEINHAITEFQKKLERLNHPNNAKALDTEEQQAEACYCVKMIQVNIQKLELLGKIAKLKLEAGIFSTKQVDPEQFDEMGKALFADTNPDGLLSRIKSFVTKTVPAVVARIIQVNQSSTVTIPKKINEILDLSTQINTRYTQAESYMKDNDIGSLALWAHKEKQRPSRPEQIKLLEDCLKDLKESTAYNEADKIKITKGLMLAIKHQVDKEFLLFKSRLETVVNDILSAESDLTSTSVSDAVKAFNHYVDTHKKLKINPDMLEKIHKTAADQKWINKQSPKPHKK